MKKILAIILLFQCSAFGAGVVAYDVNTKRVIQYERTDETPYIGKPGFIILTEKTTPTMLGFEASINSVPVYYFKVNNQNQVVEMTQNEKFNVNDQINLTQKKETRDQSLSRYDKDLVIQALVQILAEIKGVTPEEINYQVKQSINKKLKLVN